jgi:curved DNA-binding protein CbpA
MFTYCEQDVIINLTRKTQKHLRELPTMKINYFAGVTTLEELKKQYRKLAMIHHPDRGGDLQAMKDINNEYEFLFKKLPKNDKEKFAKVDDGFREIVNALINIDEIELEIMGSWLWVSGQTWEHRGILGKDGFKMQFSKNKKSWYWYDGIETGVKMRGRYTKDQIREMHGSEIIKTAKPKKEKKVLQLA